MANIERIEQREPSSLLERPSRDSRRQSQKNEALNRLRVVLAEQDRTNRWLAEQLGKTEHTISRWCHKVLSRKQINELLWNKLPVDFSDTQRLNKIGNLLMRLKRDRAIKVDEKRMWHPI